jgi:probable rRNA maturation factor
MISFTNQGVSFVLKEKNKIKQWIKLVAEKEQCKLGTINYIFCSDDELLQINIKHLNHDTFTDIITFDYTEEKVIHGDIFISIDRIRENATTFKVTFENELHRVMIHGILHLCGYKDKKRTEAKKMREMENEALITWQDNFPPDFL